MKVALFSSLAIGFVLALSGILYPQLYVAKAAFAAQQNLGVFEPESFVEFAIPIENRGRKALILGSIQSSCQCVSHVDQLEIPAGEIRQITGRVSVGHMEGRFKQSLVFRTNDRSLPNGQVEFSYAVRASLLARPQGPLIFTNAAGELTKRVTLSSRHARDRFSDVSVSTTLDFIKASILDNNGREVVVEVKLHGTPPSGDIDGALRFNASVDGQAIYKDIMVGGILNQDIRVDQEAVMLSKRSVGKTVVIHASPALALEGCTVGLEGHGELPGVKFSIHEGSRIELQVNEVPKPKEYMGGSIVVRRLSTGVPVLCVPVYIANK